MSLLVNLDWIDEYSTFNLKLNENSHESLNVTDYFKFNALSKFIVMHWINTLVYSQFSSLSKLQPKNKKCNSLKIVTSIMNWTKLSSKPLLLSKLIIQSNGNNSFVNILNNQINSEYLLKD